MKLNNLNANKQNELWVQISFEYRVIKITKRAQDVKRLQ